MMYGGKDMRIGRHLLKMPSTDDAEKWNRIVRENLAHLTGRSSIPESDFDWDQISCHPLCRPERKPRSLGMLGWSFERCPSCRTLWVWDSGWREALTPAALARLESQAAEEQVNLKQ